MQKENLIGAWKLVSARYSSPDGKANEIYGANPNGLVMYNPNGLMSIQIFRSDRPQFAKNDRRGGTPEEIKTAFEGMLSYFGTYSVDEQAQAVTHHLAGAWLPNWVGSDQTRRFEVTQDQLILRTPPLTIDGVQMNGQLVWERVG